MRKASVVLAALTLAFVSQAAAQGAADAKKKPADAATQDTSEAKKKPAGPAASAASTGPDTTTETFGDWSIICAAQAGGDRSCEVSTAIMLRNQTAPFARLAVLRAAKDKPARLVALVPVNVSVQAPVRITLDPGKSELSLPLRSCVPGGCLADLELGKDQLQTLKSPAKAPAQLILVDAAGKPASVTFSLRGLDTALDSYFKQQDR